MALTYYDKGDLIRCSAAFTDSDGAAADPDVVVFSFTEPDGSLTTYTYGTDVELVKDSTGNYHVDVDGNAAGTWFYRFHSTGSGQAADESLFQVDPGVF